MKKYEDFVEEFVKHSGGGNVLTADILKAWDEAQTATRPEKEELVEFNLEEALQDKSRVRFRNGETPLEWHYFETCKSGYPIAATDSDGFFIGATKDGKYPNSGISTKDLMLVKKKKVVWFGLYEVQSGEVITTPSFDDEKEIEEFLDKADKLLKLYSYEL